MVRVHFHPMKSWWTQNWDELREDLERYNLQPSDVKLRRGGKVVCDVPGAQYMVIEQIASRHGYQVTNRFTKPLTQATGRL